MIKKRFFLGVGAVFFLQFAQAQNHTHSHGNLPCGVEHISLPEFEEPILFAKNTN